jgi:phosphonopyruvate decarboxylase
MRLGNLSTIGHFSPPNLFHLLLNNQQHESTGGQPTTAVTTDFGVIAHASGYPRSFFLHSRSELRECVSSWLVSPICTFASLPIAAGTLESLGRPTIAPPDLAARFREFNTEG